jgi:predicted phosphate transport protein (TIGR00153 family)
MLAWFRALLPREEGFFGLFESHAAVLVSGSTVLRKALEGGPDLAANCAEVSRLENQADAITREVLLAVRRTFITPFDRSDIQDLIASMDDAIDQMQKTCKTVMLYEVTEFEPSMRGIGDAIVEAAAIAAEAVLALRDLKRNATRLGALTESITRIEDRSDGLHEQGLKALYRSSRGQDAMSYNVGAEIYDHLERVVDRFEDVANRINGIVIENL